MNKKTNHNQQKNSLGNISFEEALSELENLLSNMEKGSLTLDESLLAYRQGVSLLKRCQDELNRVEQVFSELTQSVDLDSDDSLKVKG